jgi:hypothetical protein
VLRAPSDQRKQAMADFNADLRKIAALLKKPRRRVA